MVGRDMVKIAGIEENDGTVTCKECMDEEAWANIENTRVISVTEIDKGQKIYYCDYCERRL